MAYDEVLADRLRALLATEPGLSEKKMFGGLAFLINGHMSVAVSGQGGLLVRVDPAQTEDLIASGQVEIMIMRGRAMPGWLRVAAENVTDPAELDRWTHISVQYARSLPPKK